MGSLWRRSCILRHCLTTSVQSMGSIKYQNRNYKAQQLFNLKTTGIGTTNEKLPETKLLEENLGKRENSGKKSGNGGS